MGQPIYLYIKRERNVHQAFDIYDKTQSKLKLNKRVWELTFSLSLGKQHNKSSFKSIITSFIQPFSQLQYVVKMHLITYMFYNVYVFFVHYNILHFSLF